MLLLDGISSWLKFKLILYNQADEWAEKCQPRKKEPGQSSIGIRTRKAKTAFIPPLEFLHYDNRYKACLIHDGSRATLTIDDSDESEQPSITGGNLNGEYVLENIHFHMESEHAINGTRYPLESHFVHYNKNCDTYENALQRPDGVVILAVIYKTVRCCNPKLSGIIASTEKSADEPDTLKEVYGGVVLDELLPSNRGKFYMYKGSKRTPNCNESMKWIIFEEKLHVGINQLKRIKEIKSNEGDENNNATTVIQELDDRDVFYTSDTLNLKSLTGYIKKKWCELWS